MYIVPQRNVAEDCWIETVFVRKKMRMAIFLFIIDIFIIIAGLMGEWVTGKIFDVLLLVGIVSLCAGICFRLFEKPQKIQIKFPKIIRSNNVIH